MSPRRTNTLKRAGFALFLTLAALWLLSGWLTIEWEHSRTAGYRRAASLDRGALMLSWGHWRRTARTPALGSASARLRRGPRWDYRFTHQYINGFGMGPRHTLWIPLWAPILALGIPTFLLARRSRRHPRDPNLCPCGYTLAGLAPTSPCPECGRGRTLTDTPPQTAPQSTQSPPR